MIRHTVAFKLKHLPELPPELAFLQALQRLRAIPGVGNFECLRQNGSKNHCAFGASVGLARIALHVSGFKPSAQDLYRQLGFAATGMSMFKTLAKPGR